MPHTIRLTKLNLRVKKRKAGRPTPKKNNERATTQNNQAGKNRCRPASCAPTKKKIGKSHTATKLCQSTRGVAMNDGMCGSVMCALTNQANRRRADGAQAPPARR